MSFYTYKSLDQEPHIYNSYQEDIMQWNVCHTILLMQINYLTVQPLVFVVAKKYMYILLFLYFVYLWVE